MTDIPWQVARKVVAAVLLSSASVAWAHEVLPAISDLRVEGESLDWTIELTLEALVAGVDLRGLVDTNASENSDEYDRLRALDPAGMEAALRSFWPQMRTALQVRSGDDPVDLQLSAVEIPPAGNVELPRKSVLHLTGDLPGGGEPVVVGWAPEYGALVVREDTGDPDEPGYTGFLTDGALSAPVPRRGSGFFGLFGR